MSAQFNTVMFSGCSLRQPNDAFRQPDFYKDDAPLQKIIKEAWLEQLRK